MDKKKKLDAVEAAVEERRQARDFLATRKTEAAAAKKRFDETADSEAAAQARMEKADRALEKAIKEVADGV